MFEKLKHISGNFNKKNIRNRKRKLYAKGYRAKSDQLQRFTEEYSNWRKTVFIRDKNICQCCGRRSNRLNAHHINSFARYPSLRTNIDNGITLCSSCHYVFHKKYGKDHFPNIITIGFLKYKTRIQQSESKIS